VPPDARAQGTKPDTTAGFEPTTYRLGREHRDLAEAILRLDGQVSRADVHPDFMERLRRRAAALNTHATTSIEGNPLSREEVEQMVGTRARKGEPAEQAEIRLHLAFFERLAKAPPREPLTLDEIRETHARLLTGVLPSGVGDWKRRQNVVVDENGKEVFYPSPPGRVVAELQALDAWFEASPLPSPVRVAIWAHEFASIHPFRDGNGRVGRALTHRLLVTSGLPGMAYVALDAQFLADRRGYMGAIGAVQTTAWDHAPWVGYFLSRLRAAYEESLDVLQGFRSTVEGFDGLKRAILQWVVRRGGGAFTRADFLQAPERKGYHEVSVSNALTALVGQGYLTARGERRGRRYLPGPRFHELAGLGEGTQG
jgi:Fic family protein